MPHFRTRPALALLCVLVCLASCAPAAIGSASPTATTPPAPSATPTLIMLAPTPTNAPPEWKVLATTHFSLAYPPDWTVGSSENHQYYVIWASAKHAAVSVFARPWGDTTSYCLTESSGARRTTFANLPMTFQLTGPSNTERVWQFVNAQQTRYVLSAPLYLLSDGDMAASAAAQAQDEAILATFRPDNATPWRC